MNLMKLLLVVLIFGTLVFHGNSFSQNDKQTIYNKLVERFSGINSISLTFSVTGAYQTTGQIQAKRGNKYILNLGNRTITCNGKTLWNYSKSNNSVIISNFEQSKEDFSIEEFFFNFLLGYIPTELKNETSSKGIYSKVLRLEPETRENIMFGVKYIEVKLDPKSNEIMALVINDGASSQNWTIQNLKINPKLNDSQFEFKIPKDTEIIDMQ